MSIALYNSVAPAIRQERQMELISNNLANLETAGYKRDAAMFRVPPVEDDTLAAMTDAPIPARVPLTVRIDHRPGPLKTTGNPLDMALNGDGFFSIETPDGVRYTRNGSFHLDAEGRIVTSEGHAVLGEGGPITVAAEDELTGIQLEIDAQGGISLGENELGALAIVEFEKPYSLIKTGDGLLEAPDGAAALGRPEATTVVQGALEAANTDAVGEMTRMISAYRLFESYQKMMQAADEMNDKAVNELGRVQT